MHIGIEVEGRYKGLPTLFISAEEYLNNDYALRYADIEEHIYHHIYISDRYNKIDLVSLDQFAFYVGKVVTVERTTVNVECENLNFMLFVDMDISNLKPTDQIKFDNEDKYVWTSCIESMIKTVPEDFLGDKIV